MDFGLHGKVALVLAASKGLGRASAEALAQEGANVVIGARTRQELEQTAQEIQQKSGRQILAVPVDVTRKEDAEAIVKETIRTFGRLDILVNNAGGPPFGTFDGLDEAQWQAALDLTLLSTMRFIKLALPHMRKTGSGRIINISSITVKTLLDGSLLSTVARLGVVGLAKTLSKELGPDNITVNNIATGFILTDRVRQVALKKLLDQGMSDEEAQRELAKSIPLGRLGQPEEFAALVTFLASQQAGYITGTTIPIDGGAVQSIF
jgi:3-oxoacyl-[acyl-carrier protein] reductase